jgi:beta-glucosidase
MKNPLRVLLLVFSLFTLALTTAAAEDFDARIDHLIDDMTLTEKIGQLNLRGGGSRSSYKGISEELEQDIREGRVGGLINVMLPEEVERMQQVARRESPHGIPLLIGRDVIHGLHAVAPIPLGQAATWNPGLVEKGARAAAIDASAYGINWTFAPMLDIARDPRWGRIAESVGEDPYLGSRLAEAMVRGFQGDDLSEPTSIAACMKHFAAYGAAEGGRDYNTVSMSTADLHNVYLPPFEAAVRAGTASVMSSFNEINGVPASASRMLLTDVLRNQWGFDGFVVSDWDSVIEMIPHGFSEDERAAARQSLNAGLDMEMMSTALEDHLADLVASGDVSMETLDEAVRRILRIKFRLGLFDRTDRKVAVNPKTLREDALDIARRLAIESAVLLKNDNNTLPISSDLGSIAVIGPLADAPREQLGTWSFDGRADDSTTPFMALRERFESGLVYYAPGLAYSRDHSTEGFAAAIETASDADLAIVFAGEEAILSGEAHSRADIGLPGAQEELIRELAKTDTPIVLVIMAGRPITIHEILPEVDAILMAWHPGTMAGPALADLLLGDASPSGRLPVSWPKVVGQIPVYYNHKATGRPFEPEKFTPIDEIEVGAWQSSLANTSHYMDLALAPEFPFGYGLTYSEFEYSDLSLSSAAMATNGSIDVSATITNTGDRAASEVVQLYLRDLVGSRTRPVRELEGFEKIKLERGKSRRVSFTLEAEQLRFHDGERWVLEPGGFHVWVAPDAASGLQSSFELQ